MSARSEFCKGLLNAGTVTGYLHFDRRGKWRVAAAGEELEDGCGREAGGCAEAGIRVPRVNRNTPLVRQSPRPPPRDRWRTSI